MKKIKKGSTAGSDPTPAATECEAPSRETRGGLARRRQPMLLGRTARAAAERLADANLMEVAAAQVRPVDASATFGQVPLCGVRRQSSWVDSAKSCTRLQHTYQVYKVLEQNPRSGGFHRATQQMTEVRHLDVFLPADDDDPRGGKSHLKCSTGTGSDPARRRPVGVSHTFCRSNTGNPAGWARAVCATTYESNTSPRRAKVPLAV